MMDTMFKPTSEKEFFESVDRGLAQLDAGLGKDAFESFDAMTSELEAGYRAMKAAEQLHGQKAVATS